jgi:hypothetical protein
MGEGLKRAAKPAMDRKEALMRLEAWDRLRPSMPFDLEPSLFDPPPYTTTEVERRAALGRQYDDVRRWHAEYERLLSAVREFQRCSIGRE